jgi:hypothetical protein
VYIFNTPELTLFSATNIAAELLVPLLLLVFEIYHGVLQVMYRAGVIHASSVVGIDYYQGLTAHGVINAEASSLRSRSRPLSSMEQEAKAEQACSDGGKSFHISTAKNGFSRTCFWAS